MKKVIAGLVSLAITLSNMALPAVECGITLSASALPTLAETQILPDTESTESLVSSDSVSALAEETEDTEDTEDTEEFIGSTIYGALSEGKIFWETQSEYDGAEISYFNGTDTVCIDQPGSQSEFAIPDDAKELIGKQGYAVFTVRVYADPSEPSARTFRATSPLDGSHCAAR